MERTQVAGSSNNGSGTNGKSDKVQDSNEYKGILPKTGNSILDTLILILALAFVIVPVTIAIFIKSKKIKNKF